MTKRSFGPPAGAATCGVICKLVWRKKRAAGHLKQAFSPLRRMRGGLHTTRAQKPLYAQYRPRRAEGLKKTPGWIFWLITCPNSHMGPHHLSTARKHCVLGQYPSAGGTFKFISLGGHEYQEHTTRPVLMWALRPALASAHTEK